MHILSLILCTFLMGGALAQQIRERWQTTQDKSKLFALDNSTFVKFSDGEATGTVDIAVDQKQTFQDMDGFGASLTDSSAKLLSQLKSTNSAAYNKLLNQLFNPTNGAGLTAIRVGLGATDFSEKAYTFRNTSENGPPDYFWEVLDDISKISNNIKLFLLPWSPPPEMKSSNTMNGGDLKDQNIDSFAEYLFNAVDGFATRDHMPYAIGIQNEPQNSNPSYPTASVSAEQEAEVGSKLRKRLDGKYKTVKIIGFEHNWDNAGAYPAEIMKSSDDSFAGAAFHCYAGNVKNQSLFHDQFPNKEIYHTECTGMLTISNWWDNVKWYMDNLFIGGPENWSRTAMMWNYALDDKGGPLFPGTNSCGGGCRGVATISKDKFTLNEEFYAMAHASRAVIPQQKGGPFAKRIESKVTGSQSWALRVTAYRTAGGADQTSDSRYSLVVLNWNGALFSVQSDRIPLNRCYCIDNSNGKFQPTPVDATISFRGKKAKITFPVGLTTLSWNSG